MSALEPLWGRLDPIEAHLLEAMRIRRRPALLDASMIALGRSGENGYLWAFLGVAMMFIDRRRRRAWFSVALLGPLAIAPNWLIKRFAARSRPDLGSDLQPLTAVSARSYSFPSSHATSSFAAASLAIRVEWRSRFAVLPLAGLLAAGRPYLGVHYPSDALAGALLGTGVGVCTGAALTAVLPRWGPDGH